MYKALYAVWDPEDAEEAALEDWERDSCAASIDRWGRNMGELVLRCGARGGWRVGASWGEAGKGP